MIFTVYKLLLHRDIQGGSNKMPVSKQAFCLGKNDVLGGKARHCAEPKRQNARLSPFFASEFSRLIRFISC